MFAPIVAAVFVTSGAATPDETLVETLSHPAHRTREWASGRLRARAEAGVFNDTCALLATTAAKTANAETRARCVDVINRSHGRRLALAYVTLDAATGRDYPCADAVHWTPQDGYSRETPAAVAFWRENHAEMYEDPYLPPYADPYPDRLYPWYRRVTRRYAARQLAAGRPVTEVLAELARLHQVDAIHTISYAAGRWEGDPRHYILAAFRWDCPRPDRPGAAACIPLPIPVPLPAPGP